MSYENTNCSIFLILLKVLLLLILYSEDVAACQTHCGGVAIPYPFGIGDNCYLDKSYEILCNTTSSGEQTPFLSVDGAKREVVNISLPNPIRYYDNELYRPVDDLSFGTVRVKIPITSAGCVSGGKESAETIMNITGSPFYIDYVNSLIAVGWSAKVSLTHIERNVVGCELTSNKSKAQPSIRNFCAEAFKLNTYLSLVQ